MAKKRLSDLLRDEAKSLNPKPTNAVNNEETGDVWAEPQPADSHPDPDAEALSPSPEPSSSGDQTHDPELSQDTHSSSPKSSEQVSVANETDESNDTGGEEDLAAIHSPTTEEPAKSAQAKSPEAIASPAVSEVKSTPSPKPSSKRLTKADLEKKVAQLEAALQTAQDYESKLEQDLAQMRSQIQQQEAMVQRLTTELAEAKELILKLSATPPKPLASPTKSASQSLVPVRSTPPSAPARGNVPGRPIQPGGLPPMSTETLAIAKPSNQTQAPPPTSATNAPLLNLQRVPQSGSQGDRRSPALPLMPSEKLPPAPRPSAMSGTVLPGGLPRMSTEDWLPPMSTQKPAQEDIPEMSAETTTTKPGSRLTNKELGWVD